MGIAIKKEEKNTLNLYLEALKREANNEVTGLIEKYIKQITNLEGSFLSLAIKAFGFNVIENFIVKGKKFFEALPRITTYERYLDLIESIFLSREIKVDYVSTGEIELTIINKNQELLKKYVNIKEEEYKANKQTNYKGFKAQDFLGLEAFFRRFLEPFLPAGIKLRKITLINQKVTVNEDR